MEQLTAPVGVSLKNILVATDFSAPSVSALACVVLIAQASDSVVHILHVIRPPEIAIASPEAEADISEQKQLDAQRQLGPLETVLGAVPHRMWLREGDLWTSIDSIVRSEQIDLIAVGASGKSDLKKFLVVGHPPYPSFFMSRTYGRIRTTAFNMRFKWRFDTGRV
jgi:nucleotide-binding universal stress UspA family protein